MITNPKEQKICDKFSAYDDTGHVHCFECPLRKDTGNRYDFRCKANSHYNRRTREWEYDDNGNIVGEDIFEDLKDDAYEIAKQWMTVPDGFGDWTASEMYTTSKEVKADASNS